MELDPALREKAYFSVEHDLPAGNSAQYDYFLQYALHDTSALPGIIDQENIGDGDTKKRNLETFWRAFGTIKRLANGGTPAA